MYDGMGACDHTYAADSVKGYAKVTEHLVEYKGIETPNSGIGAGHSASDTAKVPEKVNLTETFHATKLC